MYIYIHIYVYQCIYIYMYISKSGILFSLIIIQMKKKYLKNIKKSKMCLESSFAGFNQQFPGATLQVCID